VQKEARSWNCTERAHIGLRNVDPDDPKNKQKAACLAPGKRQASTNFKQQQILLLQAPFCALRVFS